MTDVKPALIREAFTGSKREELLPKRFRLEVKKNIVKTLIWTTWWGGCEAWTLKKNGVNRLEVVQMLMCKRRQICWSEWLINKDVLKGIGKYADREPDMKYNDEVHRNCAMERTNYERHNRGKSRKRQWQRKAKSAKLDE
jgi:hypothetical protein